MKNSRLFTLVTAGLIAGSFASVAVQADPGDTGKDKQVVEKRRIVIVGPDGKEKVYDSEGPAVRRGFLGVGLVELTPELRTHFGVPDDAGVLVSKVEDGSPADKAGVKVGDILARLDGKPVDSSWDIRSRVREYKDGEQVPMEIWRNGKAQTLTAAIAMRERPELDMAPMVRMGGGEHGPMMLHLEGEEEDGPSGPGGPMIHREIRMMPPGGAPGAPGMMRMRSDREADLEKQLKALEKRIAELEKLLQKK
jgi:membrane-associated protease RseP (regulator of RpoE activity)